MTIKDTKQAILSSLEITSEENKNLLKQIEQRQNSLKNLSQYLSELESQLALIFATSPDIIVFLDKEFRILKISEAATFILGYQKTEMVGRPLWDFVESSDADSLKSHLEELKIKKILYPSQRKGLVNNWITKSQKIVKLVWRFSLCDEREQQTVGIASNISDLNL